MPPPTKKPNSEKIQPYYHAWLISLKETTNYRGALTELSNFAATKRQKTMANTRPLISKIIKGHRQPSAEFLLIIQDWMTHHAKPPTD